DGETSGLPKHFVGGDSGWALEASLDTEVVHEMCQTCKVIVVETNTEGWPDLAKGVQAARSLGADEISNSYGGNEWRGESKYESTYDIPGVAVTAAAGDSGYGT